MSNPVSGSFIVYSYDCPYTPSWSSCQLSLMVTWNTLMPPPYLILSMVFNLINDFVGLISSPQKLSLHFLSKSPKSPLRSFQSWLSASSTRSFLNVPLPLDDLMSTPSTLVPVFCLTNSGWFVRRCCHARLENG